MMLSQDSHARLRHVFLRISLIAITVVLISPIFCHAGEKESEGRPRIGLVLAGGGAKGMAHIGVIEVLEELRIPIDYIAGTSMGAIVGGLYATGMSSGDLKKAILDMNWRDVFKDEQARRDRPFYRKLEDHFYMVDLKLGIRNGKITLPTGIIQGQKINLVIKELTLSAAFTDDFDELPIPFRAVATDIENGEAVILGSGELSKAILASMSIPGAFPPVQWGDRLLIDGGIALNLPIRVAREMGADIVIVSSLSSTLKKKEEIETVLDVSGQTSDFLIFRNVEEQLETVKPADVVIMTDVSGIGIADFAMGEEALSIGKEAAWKAAQDLRSLSLPEEDYGILLDSRKALPPGPPVIDFVRVDSDSRISDEVLAARISQQPGKPLDVERLNRDLNDIYGLGYFGLVEYSLIREEEKTGLVVNARSKSWGPTYLKFGLNLEGNLQGQNAFNLGFRITRTEINSLAAEWRTDFQVGETMLLYSEFRQPLEKTLRTFLVPNLKLFLDNLEVYDDTGEQIAEYKLGYLGAGIDGGYAFADWGEFRLGVRWGKGDTKRNFGLATFTEERFDIGQYFARLSLDRLDNARFPTRGSIATVGNVISSESLGADYSYNRFFFQGSTFGTLGKETFGLNLKLGDIHTGVAPVNDSYFLGGFLNLSGYEKQELIGQALGFGKVLYYHQLDKKTGGIINIPLYLGASLEAGNVWSDRGEADISDLILAGSLFLGADTPVGPLYLAYGRADTGRDSFYFYLGRTF